jgi:hypothetical protein
MQIAIAVKAYIFEEVVLVKLHDNIEEIFKESSEVIYLD